MTAKASQDQSLLVFEVTTILSRSPSPLGGQGRNQGTAEFSLTPLHRRSRSAVLHTASDLAAAFPLRRSGLRVSGTAQLSTSAARPDCIHNTAQNDKDGGPPQMLFR